MAALGGTTASSSSLGFLQCLAHPERYGGYVRKLAMLSYGRWWLRAQGVSFGAGLNLFGLPIVSTASTNSIVLGDRVTLCSRSADTALGVSRPVVLRTLTQGAQIHIGSDTGLSGTAVCAARSVVIGARCLFGADVMVVDTDFHPLLADGRFLAPVEAATSREVVIEDDVFIGARAIILKGVTIGRGAVVGAGAVVVHDVEPYCVVAGNPASRIGKLEPDGRVSNATSSAKVQVSAALAP